MAKKRKNHGPSLNTRCDCCQEKRAKPRTDGLGNACKVCIKLTAKLFKGFQREYHYLESLPENGIGVR